MTEMTVRARRRYCIIIEGFSAPTVGDCSPLSSYKTGRRAALYNSSRGPPTATATTVDVQGVWECWTILTGIAAITERVEIGSLVTPTSFRNPAVFAKQIDAIEEISDGRITSDGPGRFAPPATPPTLEAPR